MGAEASTDTPASPETVPRADDGGLARSVRLLRLFRSEQADPEQFYTVMGADAVSQVASYTEIAGRTVVDVGGGPGWFSAAFRARGARCLLIERDADELYTAGRPQGSAAIADGLQLPLRDGAADIAFTSNVLEHVPDPLRMIAELIRVTRPGGLIYLAFTNWYSPWGGHELSPWHYLGAGFAERKYTRRYQREPKHQVGKTLFRVHVGTVLRAVRARGDIEILDARPRYYPKWCSPLIRIPALREVVTWNLMVVMRRTG
jgi:SAM-dependent methyltransferase